MTNTKQKTKQLSTKKGEISSKLVVDKTIKERVEEFEKLLPCINRDCDGKGSIPERDGEGNWQQAQCEYCFVVRFPMFKAITKALKQTEERVIGEMKMEEMVWAEPLVGSELETWNRAVRYFNDKINKLKRK